MRCCTCCCDVCSLATEPTSHDGREGVQPVACILPAWRGVSLQPRACRTSQSAPLRACSSAPRRRATHAAPMFRRGDAAAHCSRASRAPWRPLRVTAMHIADADARRRRAALSRSIVFFADDTGRMVLGRDYRGDVGRLRVAAFCEARLRAGSSPLARGDAPPLALFDGSTFVARRLRGATGVWLVGATNGNANAALLVEALAALERLTVAYFADEAPTASALRGKAALVFALLDEARAPLPL